MESQEKRILIIGGYGQVGSNIARLIRKNDSYVEIILAGRSPKNGELLVKELTNAKTAYINLEEGFDLNKFQKIDLIISALSDHTNILRETAISNRIACITVSEVADQISTTAFLALHKTITAPIVFAGHWQAGLLTLVVKHLAAKFSNITSIETAGLYDEKDPVGPLVKNEVTGFVGRALIRQDRNWLHVDAKTNTRVIDLYNGESAIGHPMGTLDVPSIAAFTDAANIRFDFVIGNSIGSTKGIGASHDLYIEIEGTLVSGEKKNLRTIVSGPKGNSHLTAVGIYLITEKILGFNGRSVQKTGGLYLPETIISEENIIKRLAEFGIQTYEDIS
ncbi:saccharopine dehydrogenase NADP-binding domain-containing protein [Chryseobacterium wangxinyae]|uniref:saccharopine dehydrogenase NADP-binding domain-containing protein n=1 Tax=Chryseobacterium sp. CY350 TaxID=2997336 RepID=UPI00226F0AD4|nr:saccharopine dehydrogenase NADP-binding domain-containing protein [Chryseobacterium sp. CY350]MCY0979321.1 saccharopine dehydrogenase NADP-binding domain-containing protein [Chryseobacterium sp. CY350]WBZ95953.1 saccharopine dehydrogenase NADP-binding domain-containing protein [Chryseobacterium sp. CY350]